ncbi:MAG: hypothetical protein IT332_12455 [Ardenticatenales bacterium]|nr:hypothetical protein [Ardenticatenales bacterium]
MSYPTSPLSTIVPGASRFVLPADPRAAILAGALAGAIWGVVARVWMRVISAEHEFSWGGTLGIIGIFAVFGLGQAVAAIARRSAWPIGWQIATRILTIVATIPMGLAAGAPMLPYLLLAALALGRTDLHRGVRFALAALAAVPTLFVLRQLVDDLVLWRAVVGWMLMFAVYAPLVWALAQSLRPFVRREMVVVPA